MKKSTLIAMGVVAAVLCVAPVSAQQVTGVHGSPSATTTISGKQLPPPPPKFVGKIERNALLERSAC